MAGRFQLVDGMNLWFHGRFQRPTKEINDREESGQRRERVASSSQWRSWLNEPPVCRVDHSQPADHPLAPAKDSLTFGRICKGAPAFDGKTVRGF